MHGQNACILSHALTQECEEMARILASSRNEQEDTTRNWTDNHQAEIEISAGPWITEKQAPLLQEHQKAKRTDKH